MTTPLIGAIVFVILLALLTTGIPIAFAMILVAFVGLVICGGLPGALTQLSTVPIAEVSNYSMSTIPLFVLMGSLAFASGLVTNAYRAAYTWIGSLPGGLAMSTILGCAGFAACTGSSIASVGVITKTALPEMIRYNYDTKLATGCIAGGTTLGILIPPSIPIIVYGLLSNESIGRLFIASIVPGLLLTALFCIAISILVKFRPGYGPPGPKTSWRQKFVSLKSVWGVIMLAGIVLGGIWGGVFSPIEAGGVGAFGALIIALVGRQLTIRKCIEALSSTMGITAMIFTMMIGALLFNRFMALTMLPAWMAEFVISLQMPATIVVILVMLFYLIGGCLMDTLGLMMLTLPIFIPIMRIIGVDLTFFGVITTIGVEMALITPPIGMNVFILSGMAPDIPMYTIFRGIVPFLIAMIVCLGLIIAFPQIALFLPDLMR